MNKSSADAERYLERIGHAGPVRGSLDTLTELTRLHVATIPFENATSFGPGPSPAGAVAVDTDSVMDKLLSGYRGGYCFEHATLLHHVLPALGFHTRYLAARTYRDPSHVPSAKTHVVVTVRLDDREFLVDTGFGGLTPAAPLDLGLLNTAQQTPHGRYRVIAASAAGVNPQHTPDVDVMIQAELTTEQGTQWTDLYALDLRGIAPIDLPALNWYISTSPRSLFTNTFTVALAPGDQRITISNTVIRQRTGASSVKQTITSTDHMRHALQTLAIKLPTNLLSVIAARLELQDTHASYSPGGAVRSRQGSGTRTQNK